MGGFSLLGQLAGGYAQAAEREHQRAFEVDQQNRQNMMGVGKMLLENAATPAEYKASIAQWMAQIANTKLGQKLPSFDKMAQSVPQIGTAAKTQNVQIPQIQMGMPAAPPMPQGIGTGQQQGPLSLTQSATAANGGAPPYIPPPIGQGGRAFSTGQGVTPISAAGAGPVLPEVAPPPIPLQSTMGPKGEPIPVMTQQGGPTLPGGSQAVTQAASANYTPAGQFHFMSPQEIAERDAQVQLQRAQQIAQSTGLPLAQVLGIKPDVREVGPGGKLVNVTPGGQGAVIAEGGPPTAMLTKEKYSVDAGPGGEIRGIIDNTGARPVHLTPEEAAKIPEANKLLQDAQSALEAHENRLISKEQRQFGRQLQIQFNAMANAIQLGAVKDAQKAASDARTTFTKMNQSFAGDQARYQIMQKAYQDAIADPNNVGSFDAALLAFHMGMTVGQVKGMRTGQQMIEMHQKARSLGEDFEVALGRLEHGEQLSDEQRANFLKLAQDKMAITQQQVNTARQDYQTTYDQYSQFVGGASRGKAKTPKQAPSAQTGAQPPQQSPGGGGGGEGTTAVNPSNGHTIIVRGGKWVDAQTGVPVQ